MYLGEKLQQVSLLLGTHVLQRTVLIITEYVLGGFGNTLALGRQSSKMYTPVARADTAGEHALFVQQLHLPADARFRLAEIDRNMPLLNSGAILQREKDLILRKTDAELFLQDLIGLTRKDSREVMQ